MISLRLARTEDAAAIAAIYAPFVEDGWTSFEERAPDAIEMAERVEELAGLLPFVVAAAGPDGTLAGYAYASRHRARAGYRWSADVSVYLDERFRRSGVATRLYAAIFAMLAAQRYVNVYAGIAQPNDASNAFHRRMGFVDVGTYRNVGFKAGAWHDVLWLQHEIGTRETPPGDPLRLDDLAPHAVAAILAR